MKGQRLQVIDKFTYLGSTLSRVVHNDDEVNARIAKASAAFGRIRGSIWDRSGIRLDTKLKVFRSVVLPTLLYACETWTVYQWHAKRLNHFQTSCLRKLLKIKWQDRIPDTEALKRAGMQSIHTLLKLAQLRWTGHVCQRKSSMENFKLENAPMVVRRRDTRTPSKPPLKTSTYQQSHGNRLHKIVQRVRVTVHCVSDVYRSCQHVINYMFWHSATQNVSDTSYNPKDFLISEWQAIQLMLKFYNLRGRYSLLVLENWPL